MFSTRRSVRGASKPLVTSRHTVGMHARQWRAVGCFLADAYISARHAFRGNAVTSLTPNPTTRRSEEYLLSPAITVLRVLLCLSLAGCSENEDSISSHSPTAPDILGQPSVVVIAGSRAIFTCWVNPRGLDTRCYFEYGPTISYGRQLPAKSIGSKTAYVFIRDTAANLSADTTYHCRVVAANSHGNTVGADRDFSLAEFIYPLTVGTRWWYRYYYHGYDWNFAVHRGSQLWEVVERISADSVRIQVSRSDTSIWGGSVSPPVEQQSQVSFGASRTGDSYVVGWKDIIYNSLPRVLGDYFTVARYVETGRDTVRLSFRASYSECICLYVNGKGLVSYYYAHSPNAFVTETLTLDSVTVAP
jgi:hypothetical protein